VGGLPHAGRRRDYDEAPIVNVTFDNDAFDMGSSNIVERQKATGTFNVDCYAQASPPTTRKASDTRRATRPQQRSAARRAARALDPDGRRRTRISACAASFGAAGRRASQFFSPKQGANRSSTSSPRASRFRSSSTSSRRRSRDSFSSSSPRLRHARKHGRAVVRAVDIHFPEFETCPLNRIRRSQCGRRRHRISAIERRRRAKSCRSESRSSHKVRRAPPYPAHEAALHLRGRRGRDLRLSQPDLPGLARALCPPMATASAPSPFG
jgi:hypothetical protein